VLECILKRLEKKVISNVDLIQALGNQGFGFRVSGLAVGLTEEALGLGA
jgi:hypothetical protein